MLYVPFPCINRRRRLNEALGDAALVQSHAPLLARRSLCVLLLLLCAYCTALFHRSTHRLIPQNNVFPSPPLLLLLLLLPTECRVAVTWTISQRMLDITVPVVPSQPNQITLASLFFLPAPLRRHVDSAGASRRRGSSRGALIYAVLLEFS